MVLVCNTMAFFLLLLEGQLMQLPAAKSHYAKDIVFTGDTPIFAIGKNPIVFVKNGLLDEKETEMVNLRWKIFRFRANCERKTKGTACLWQMLCHFNFG